MSWVMSRLEMAQIERLTQRRFGSIRVPELAPLGHIPLGQSLLGVSSNMTSHDLESYVNTRRFTRAGLRQTQANEPWITPYSIQDGVTELSKFSLHANQDSFTEAVAAAAH